MTPQQTNWEKLGKHVLDIVKGAIAAALTAAVFALLQYLGAHIPELLQYGSQVATATAAMKLKIRV